MAGSDIPDIPLVDWEDATEALDAELKNLSKDGKRQARRSRSRTPAQKPPLRPWKNGAIAAHATRLYNLAALAAKMRGKTELADAIEQTAEPAGKAWEKVAKRYEWVRRIFEMSMATGDLSDLAMAHMPMAIYAAGKAGFFGPVAEEFREELANEMKETVAGAAA